MGIWASSLSMTVNNFDDDDDVDDDVVDDDVVDKSIFLNLISYKAVTIRLRQDVKSRWSVKWSLDLIPDFP